MADRVLSRKEIMDIIYEGRRMTRKKVAYESAVVRKVLDGEIMRAAAEDRDCDYDRLVHARVSFDNIVTELMRRIGE